jgi:predicted acetyltransferase
MSVELRRAVASDKNLIEALLDDYLRELNTYREAADGAVDSTTYPYLDAYWAEPGRHAFLIVSDGQIVGFVLIRDPDSTQRRVSEVAEFCIERRSRRRGIGRAAASAIWRSFPGDWEIQVYARNSAAVRFWSLCAEAEAREAPSVTEVYSDDGRRLQYNFTVRHAAQQGDEADRP